MWLILVSLSLFLLIHSLPARLQQLQHQAQIETATINQLGLTVRLYVIYFFTLDLIFVAANLVIGSLVFWHKSDEWLPLLVSAMLITGAVVGNPQFLQALVAKTPGWQTPVTLLRGICGGCVLAFAYLFPNSQFTPRRVWVLLVCWWVWAVSWLVWPRVNPYHLLVSQSQPLLLWPFWLAILFGASALYAQIHRCHSETNAIIRQQTRWIVFGFTIALFAHFIYFSLLALFPVLRGPGTKSILYTLLAVPVLVLCLTLIPISIAVAVFYARLWNVTPIIKRTLVYSILSAITLGLYGLAVGGLSAIFPNQNSVLVSFLVISSIAIVLQPLHGRLRHRAEELLFGEPTDPLAALIRLGQRLEVAIAPNEVLPSIVETIMETLALPYAAVTIKMGESFSIAASLGRPTKDMLCLPLIHQGETIGQLIVAPQFSDKDFSRAEQALIQGIAHQVGTAVHAVHLTFALQRTRQSLVTAQEAERLRLRRDLHDGLGPMLASQGLKLAACQQLLDCDPQKASTLLDSVLHINETAVSEIRRLVYGLRPPALDELGLVGAIRDYAAGAKDVMRLQTGLRVRVEGPKEGLPCLPAAVEVAAYRIALEALTNVTRHARARHCVISLILSDDHDCLHLTITDDGSGLHDTHRSGVGLRSMRERAEELGGTFSIESLRDVGTRVSVKFPLVDKG